MVYGEITQQQTHQSSRRWEKRILRCVTAGELVFYAPWRANQQPGRYPKWVRRALMFSLQWRTSFRPSRPQVIAFVLLVITIAALLPIPLLSSGNIAGKDRSRPFPCQDRPCGCRSAEQCKKKCCCFTAEQKLAWAKRNGIDPSEVVASAPACKPDTLTTRKVCCSSRQLAKSETTKPSRRSKTPVSRFQVVIGVIAQECQGVAQSFYGQTVFVVPPIVSLSIPMELKGERIAVGESRFVKLCVEPPVPPPRLA